MSKWEWIALIFMVCAMLALVAVYVKTSGV